jgi:hypothetical protein
MQNIAWYLVAANGLLAFNQSIKNGETLERNVKLDEKASRHAKTF